MSARVEEFPGTAFTQAVIVADTPEEVEEATNEYFRSYDPAGYSTRVRVPLAKRLDGKWYTGITRYSSCD